jgi:outer membrane protein TolC
MILKRHFIGVLLLGALLILWEDVAAQPSRYQWEDPFASRSETVIPGSDSLTLQAVLDLVAEANPALKAGRSRVEAARGLLKQASLRPNPELEVEFEEVGWDAPGFGESEISASFSQEVELWG